MLWSSSEGPDFPFLNSQSSIIGPQLCLLYFLFIRDETTQDCEDYKQQRLVITAGGCGDKEEASGELEVGSLLWDCIA